MKVIFHRRDASNVSVRVDEEMEVDDNATAEDIDEQLKEWVWNDIDTWWDKAEDSHD